MVSAKILVAFFACVLALCVAAPSPGGWGGWGHGGHHKHVVIHVPSHYHTVHHHHVKKIPVPVPVPVVKKIFVHAEPIHDHHDHHDYGGWW